MKIGIDVSTITPTKAGVGYYTFELTKALLEADKENTYLLYTNDIDNVGDFSIYPNAIIVTKKSKKAGLKWIVAISKHANKNVDYFISPANFSFSLFAKNTIQAVHDLAPVKYPKYFSKKGTISYKLQLKLAMKRAKKIVTLLEAIRQELIQYYPDSANKVITIGAGTNDWTKSELSIEEIDLVARKYSLPKKFLLTTGTLEPRKNHVNMIKAFKSFSRMNPDYSYVIVGKKGWYYDEIFKTVTKLKLEEKVMFLGYVPEEDLLAISFSATAFIFCSFYEGFGLPLVEAASLKLPILCSDIASFREIFEDTVEYANPTDTADITRGLRKVIETKNVDYHNRLQNYTWDKTARNLLSIINAK